MAEDSHEGPLADKEKVRRKGLQEKLDRRTELGDIASLLSTRSGRRFFNRMLCAGKMFAPIFTGNNSTFARAAEHDIMLPFLADAQNFPDLYLQMIRESREKDLPEETEKGPRMLENPNKKDETDGS